MLAHPRVGKTKCRHALRTDSIDKAGSGASRSKPSRSRKSMPRRSGSGRKVMSTVCTITSRLACTALAPALLLAASSARAEPPKLPVPAVDQSAVAQRGYFYVGGQYTGEPGKEIMQGQIYVEVLAPKDVRRPYPLVLIHGAAQTATNWMGTPDGRKGWAEYFVEQGYVVYMIDQPMRGRSAWHPGDGATRMFTAQQEEFQFTANAVKGTW